jgi:hypothetical protein
MELPESLENALGLEKVVRVPLFDERLFSG